MSVSRKIELLERIGKLNEARNLLKNSQWYRCNNLYYKPSAKIILDGSKQYSGELDTKNCNPVPFNQVDALEAKIGITNRPVVTSTTSKPQSTPRKKGSCCR